MTYTTTADLAAAFEITQNDANNLIKYGLPELSQPTTNGQPRRLLEREAVMFGVAIELRKLNLPAPVVKLIVDGHQKDFAREDLAVIAHEGGACSFYCTDELNPALVERYNGRPMLVVPLEPIREKVRKAVAATSGPTPPRLPGGWGSAPVPEALRRKARG